MEGEPLSVNLAGIFNQIVTGRGTLQLLDRNRMAKVFQDIIDQAGHLEEASKDSQELRDRLTKEDPKSPRDDLEAAAIRMGLEARSDVIQGLEGLAVFDLDKARLSFHRATETLRWVTETLEFQYRRLGLKERT